MFDPVLNKRLGTFADGYVFAMCENLLNASMRESGPMGFVVTSEFLEDFGFGSDEIKSGQKVDGLQRCQSLASLAQQWVPPSCHWHLRVAPAPAGGYHFETVDARG